MKKKIYIVLTIAFIIILCFLIYQKIFIPEKPLLSEMKINSVFKNNERIPSEYTCDGKNISPPLEITEIPENAKTLAIISDDPDAPMGTWVHWLVWNIPVSGERVSIKEGEKISVEGTNDFGKIAYGGPCPPSGTHRYFFKVYALNTELKLEQGAQKEQLEKAMHGEIIERAELIGLYSKNNLSI